MRKGEGGMKRERQIDTVISTCWFPPSLGKGREGGGRSSKGGRKEGRGRKRGKNGEGKGREGEREHGGEASEVE